MGIATKLDRNGEFAKIADVTGEIDAFVRHRQTESDGQLVAQQLSTVLRQFGVSSLHEIDTLLTELQTMRDKLHATAVRVQQELAAYSALSQSALQSTKVITESLRNNFPRRTT